MVTVPLTLFPSKGENMFTVGGVSGIGIGPLNIIVQLSSLTFTFVKVILPDPDGVGPISISPEASVPRLKLNNSALIEKLSPTAK